MSRFRSSLIAAGVLAALVACDEAAAPKGTPGDLTVRVYVDKDASGAWSAGDSAITGVTVQAFAGTTTEGATPAGTATTVADSGKAVIQGLQPGIYTVALGAGAPAGAAVVLLTNPTPQVAVSQQGAVSATPEFRYAPNAGRISGRIYSDVNTSGTYDAGDVPGAGLSVAVRRNNNGAAGDTVAILTADEEGAYASGPLALGSYFVQFENPGSITYTTPELAQVSLTGGTTLAVSNTFTGSLVLTIRAATARAVNSQVAVLGSVTVAPGQITSSTGSRSEVWVQDTSGGIAVFPVPSSDSLTYPLGTRVLVTGVRSLNGGAAQIGTTSNTPVLQVRTGGSLVAPIVQTGAQVNARTSEGRLVTITGFTVTSVGAASGTTGAYTVTGTTPDGQTVQVRVTGPVTLQVNNQPVTFRNNGIATTDWQVGSRYTVTGVLTQFNGTAQIKTRQRSDVSGPTAIGTVRTSAANQVYTVSGQLTVAPGAFTSGTGGVNSEIWVQDATGGIAVFSVPTANTAGLALGDRVEVTGTLGAFANQLQIQNTPTVTRLAAAAPVVPRTVTGTELLARTYEGQLVTLASFTVTALSSTTATAFNVTGTAGSGETVSVRVAGTSTGLNQTNFVVGQTYSVTGIATINNTTVQIKPRSRADVTP